MRDRLAVIDPDNKIGAASAGSEKRRAAGHTPQFKRGPNGEVGLLNELIDHRPHIAHKALVDRRAVLVQQQLGRRADHRARVVPQRLHLGALRQQTQQPLALLRRPGLR